MVLNEFASAKKQQKEGKKNNDIYSGAYYALGGLISGYLFDEFWHKFNLPTDKVTESLINHQPIENINGITLDKFTITALSGILALSEVVLGLRGGAASAGGLMIGYNYAHAFRDKKYIGQI